MSDTEQADVAAAARVHVSTATINLKSQPFIPGEDPIVIGKTWDDWFEEIEWKFRYFKITEPVAKKDALIIYGGKEIARLEKRFRGGSGIIGSLLFIIPFIFF